jgi:pyruvate ferredoxin oxidoreductase beta subunit
MRARDKERFAFFEYMTPQAEEVINRVKEEGLL